MIARAQSRGHVCDHSAAVADTAAAAAAEGHGLAADINTLGELTGEQHVHYPAHGWEADRGQWFKRE